MHPVPLCPFLPLCTWHVSFDHWALLYEYSLNVKRVKLCTLYHEKKKTFPMLCTLSPCVHSYHFAPGMCLSIIGPYYMNIHWMYCRMTKLKNVFSHINITVSKCFFNNNSCFFKKINHCISHVSTTTTVSYRKKSIFQEKCLFANISRSTISCWLTMFLIFKKCQFHFWIITTIFSSTVVSFWTKSVPYYKLNSAGTCCLRTKV